MKILNFGSMNLDYVYSVEHMVMPGETLASKKMDAFCGGKGLNQSIALAKAGASVYHAGMVGEDGQILIDIGKEAGVHMEYVKMIPGRSGHAIIQVDSSGQNSILLNDGANGKITKEYVDEIMAYFHEGDMLLLQNEINMLDYIIDQAYEKGMVISMNPSPYNQKLKECNFEKISVFLLNEIEAAQLTGEAEVERILKKMKEKFPKTKMVLTLGENGSVYQYGSERYVQKAFKTKAVDTTAAGDTFTGYFLSALADGMDVEKGLELAAKASAIAVSRKGASVSIPMKDEVLCR